MADNETKTGAQVMVTARVTVASMPATLVPDLQARIYAALSVVVGATVELTMREPRPERLPTR